MTIQRMQRQSVELVNVVERNKEHPDTFKIPTRKQREGLQVGDCVKLVWEGPTMDGISGERMWVTVTKVEKGRYEGRLESKPFVLAVKDDVVFGPEHVATANGSRHMESKHDYSN